MLFTDLFHNVRRIHFAENCTAIPKTGSDHNVVAKLSGLKSQKLGNASWYSCLALCSISLNSVTVLSQQYCIQVTMMALYLGLVI